MMLLPLKPRIDFGGIPFDPLVAEFNLTWLRGTFVPAARKHRDVIISAVTAANDRITEAQDRIRKGMPVAGERRANGTTLVNVQLQQAAKTIADRQIVEAIAAIKAEADAVCVPALKYLERSALTAKALNDRVFDKLSCLARVTADMRGSELMAYRAGVKGFVDGAEPIVLHRYAQAAIDRGRPEDLMLISAILNENLKLPKDRRAFTNSSLLDLVNPPEFLEGSNSLTQVLDLHKEAGAAYARLAGHVGQASIMRISRGLAAVKLDKDGIPLAGDEE